MKTTPLQENIIPMDTITERARDYFEEHLRPLMESIVPTKTESLIYKATGLNERTSVSSIVIQFGDRIEKFWNRVISDSKSNLIEDGNRIIVEGKERQIDHLFQVNDIIYYLESKCNLEFDTEKRPASNKKIRSVAEVVEQQYGNVVVSGYFNPVVREIPAKIIKKYPDTNIYGVNWLLDMLECDLFTCEEFFSYLESDVGPIIIEKERAH